MSLRMKITIKGDEQVMRKLAVLRRAGDDNHKIMEEIGREAIDYFSKDAFATKGRVFGAAWPDYNPAYKKWKEKHYAGRGMLQLTGTMQDGFFAVATKSSVTIDNHSAVYKYHQSTAARNKLPRRAMAGINPAIKRMVRDKVSQDIDRRMRAA